jgi:hypothetical protein
LLSLIGKWHSIQGENPMTHPENPIQTTLKTKNKLYVLCLQSEDGKIERIFTGTDYDLLWLQGSTESKAISGFWSTYDVQGRFIDGNFNVKATK